MKVILLWINKPIKAKDVAADKKVQKDLINCCKYNEPLSSANLNEVCESTREIIGALNDMGIYEGNDNISESSLLLYLYMYHKNMIVSKIKSKYEFLTYDDETILINLYKFSKDIGSFINREILNTTI